MSDMKTSLRKIDVPQSDVGAPTPIVLAEENWLLFGYYVQTHAENEPFDTCAIVCVESYLALKFGYPNDEAIRGHRYARVGLEPYSAYEVLDSEWIREMREANRVHPHHTDRMFASDRHFICREAAARRASLDSFIHMRQGDLTSSGDDGTKQRGFSPFQKLLGFFGLRYRA